MEVEPRCKGKHFTQDERAKIEALHKAGLTHQAIADIIGCCRSAITRELKKGQVEHLDYKTWIVSKVYDAYAAQQTANYQKTAHSKGLKLGNNHAYAAALGECICMGYSPYAAIQKVHMSIKQQPRPLELHRRKGLSLYPIGIFISPTFCADLPHQ